MRNDLKIPLPRQTKASKTFLVTYKVQLVNITMPGIQAADLNVTSMQRYVSDDPSAPSRLIITSVDFSTNSTNPIFTAEAAFDASSPHERRDAFFEYFAGKNQVAMPIRGVGFLVHLPGSGDYVVKFGPPERWQRAAAAKVPVEHKLEHTALDGKVHPTPFDGVLETCAARGADLCTMDSGCARTSLCVPIQGNPCAKHNGRTCNDTVPSASLVQERCAADKLCQFNVGTGTCEPMGDMCDAFDGNKLACESNPVCRYETVCESTCTDCYDCVRNVDYIATELWPSEKAKYRVTDSESLIALQVSHFSTVIVESCIQDARSKMSDFEYLLTQTSVRATCNRATGSYGVHVLRKFPELVSRPLAYCKQSGACKSSCLKDRDLCVAPSDAEGASNATTGGSVDARAQTLGGSCRSNEDCAQGTCALPNDGVCKADVVCDPMTGIDRLGACSGTCSSVCSRYEKELEKANAKICSGPEDNKCSEAFGPGYGCVQDSSCRELICDASVSGAKAITQRPCNHTCMRTTRPSMASATFSKDYRTIEVALEAPAQRFSPRIIAASRIFDAATAQALGRAAYCTLSGNRLGVTVRLGASSTITAGSELLLLASHDLKDETGVFFNAAAAVVVAHPAEKEAPVSSLRGPTVITASCAASKRTRARAFLDAGASFDPTGRSLAQLEWSLTKAAAGDTSMNNAIAAANAASGGIATFVNIDDAVVPGEYCVRVMAKSALTDLNSTAEHCFVKEATSEKPPVQLVQSVARFPASKAYTVASLVDVASFCGDKPQKVTFNWTVEGPNAEGINSELQSSGTFGPFLRIREGMLDADAEYIVTLLAKFVNGTAETRATAALFTESSPLELKIATESGARTVGDDTPLMMARREGKRSLREPHARKGEG